MLVRIHGCSFYDISKRHNLTPAPCFSSPLQSSYSLLSNDIGALDMVAVIQRKNYRQLRKPRGSAHNWLANTKLSSLKTYTHKSHFTDWEGYIDIFRKTHTPIHTQTHAHIATIKKKRLRIWTTTRWRYVWRIDSRKRRKN